MTSAPGAPQPMTPYLPLPERRRLESAAARIRSHVLRMTGQDVISGQASLDLTNVLSVAYFRWLRVDPANPTGPDRDRFVLGRRDGLLALFATLIEAGFLRATWLQSNGQRGVAFDEESMVDVPSVDAGRDAFGRGLSHAVGMALATQMMSSTRHRTVVVLDDEFDDGSTEDVGAFAVRAQLGTLVAIVLRADPQETMWAHEERWTGIGWRVIPTLGDTVDEIARALDAIPPAPEQPTLVLVRMGDRASGQGSMR